ncbi:MAG: MBL fold metallo-hydrolase, partial [Selenomonas sp.]|nr:MBL fold metallo-hydrolase [Selenomonas sp.]
MLDIAIHATGSTGNCYTVSNGKATVMLDCGLPYNRIQKLTGFILPDAVFVTHEHQDHVKAAKDFMKRGVDIYTSAGTAEVENLEGHLLHIMKNRQSVSI